MSFRNLILKIHIYGGLVSFWYLLILGTSSLNFNHHFSFMEGQEETTTWTHPLQIENNLNDDLKLSEAIRDSLSLIGWPLPWETWHDSTGIFHFVLEQPAKRYVIDYSFTDHLAKVAETPKGFWRVFNSLHGGGGVPNAPFLHAWTWYTRITVVVVVFSVIIGIYLWFTGNQDKKSGWYTLVISLMLSLIWMIQLYLEG